MSCSSCENKQVVIPDEFNMLKIDWIFFFLFFSSATTKEEPAQEDMI